MKRTKKNWHISLEKHMVMVIKKWW